MIIGNAQIFLNGKFTLGSIEFDNGTITRIGAPDAPCDIDAGGKYLVPGLIDVHTHGAMGGDASDGDTAGLSAISRHMAKHGVTSFLPTTLTLKEPELTAAMQTIRNFSRPENCAKIAGVNLEGPFLSGKKCGAQNPDNIHQPDFDMLCRLNEASGGMVRLVSVAPEEDADFDFIKKASQICTVSIGHTTADYDTAMAAFAAGASHVTHLFNAMPPFTHRSPGVVGAAFDAGATVELICDGVHIHKSVIRAVQRLFGERMVIISDSLSCAGQPDGNYELGGLPIVMKDGHATLLDGTIAGSSSNLMDELRIVVSCGIALEDALISLTAAPAKAAKLKGVGSLDIGNAADMLLLDEKLNLCSVFIDGEQIEA